MADLRDKLRAREGRSGGGSGGSGSGGNGPGPKRGPARKPAAGAKAMPTGASPVLDVNRKLLFAAAGIAALAGLVAVMYLSDLASGIAGEGAKVAVWTVKENVPARHQLTEDDLVVREIPKTFLAEGYLTREEAAAGQITRVPLVKGEVVLKARVGKPGAEFGGAPKLRANERGFVYVPDGLQEVPLVKPDDLVDLIATLPEPGTERLISTPVLQKVRVLSVGDRFSDEATDSPPLGNAAITLAVPASKVTLLTILKQAGNLNFALRSPGDTSESPSRIPEAEIERLVMGQVPRPAAPRPAAAAQPVRPRPVVRTRYIERPAPRPVAIQPRPQPVVQQRPAPRPPQPRPIEIHIGRPDTN